MLLLQVASWLSLGSVALAGAIPKDSVLAERQDGECTHTARTRGCWRDGFSISTDFDAKSPPAGKVVTYDLEITNTTLNPDGVTDRPAMLINGQYPGPLIRATWGDTLVINVKNSLKDNGTGIHWHGIRQLNSCQQDGVGGITECPIAPGKTRQYRFKATQFGTSWYHSHWSSQYGEGVVGTMIIDGPATENYDEDLGTVALTEWYYLPGFLLNERAQMSKRGPPNPNNLLVNGEHKNAQGGGKYHKLTVKKGKKYRVRLINTSVDSSFHVSFDGHPMTIMTSDFVPIKKRVATELTINIGQRYDVMINANQTSGNYWMHVVPGSCTPANDIVTAKVQTGAILHYDDAEDTEPAKKAPSFTKTGCDDETNLVPFVPNTVPKTLVPESRMNLNSKQNEETEQLFRWTIDGETQVVDWNHPTLDLAINGAETFGKHSNIYKVPTKDNWYLWYIKSNAPAALPHPIHLHGHDYYVVGSGAGSWDGTDAGLTFENPTRRDTATLPAGGWLLLAFPADNPGVWVMHCHIAWHASQGLSVQFLEQQGDIRGTIGDLTEFNKGCTEWNEYWQPGKHYYNQTDSGL